MTIVVDNETHYNYLKTFENVIILKLFADCGVDVNFHAGKFNLHIAYTYGYTSGYESLELFEMLYPHLLKELDATILGTEYSTLGLAEISNDEKKDMIHSFFKGCSNLHPADKFPKLECYGHNVVVLINGDFSFVNVEELQKHAYPFNFEFKELYSKLDGHYYSNPYFQLDKVPNHATTDDGMDFCFYVNDQKNQFLLAYDAYEYGFECYPLANLLCNLYRIVKGEKK